MPQKILALKRVEKEQKLKAVMFAILEFGGQLKGGSPTVLLNCKNHIQFGAGLEVSLESVPTNEHIVLID